MVIYIIDGVRYSEEEYKKHPRYIANRNKFRVIIVAVWLAIYVSVILLLT